MFTLLRIKFKPGSKFATKLLATGNQHLAESGRGFYACGLSITDKNPEGLHGWHAQNMVNRAPIAGDGKVRHNLHSSLIPLRQLHRL